MTERPEPPASRLVTLLPRSESCPPHLRGTIWTRDAEPAGLRDAGAAEPKAGEANRGFFTTTHDTPPTPND